MSVGDVIVSDDVAEGVWDCVVWFEEGEEVGDGTQEEKEGFEDPGDGNGAETVAVLDV